MLLPRNLKSILLEASQRSRVLLLNGARQTGKSTLLHGLYEPEKRPAYVTLDDLSSLDAARKSPKSFLQRFPGPVMIDEIQRAPELFLSIKEIVDKDKTPGRFFLSGSANALNLPRLSDSLAGRMEIHSLWPLSQGEFAGSQEAFVDTVFGKEKSINSKHSNLTEATLFKHIVRGGYPEAAQRESTDSRSHWFESYITTILERDVRELSNIDGLTSLPNLLSLLASRSGGLLNLSDLSRSLQLPNTSLQRYMSLLEAVFLTVSLPPWFGNIGKRLVKAPKIYLNDTGLLCHLLGQDEESLLLNRPYFGMVFENFVVMEIKKQISWSKLRPRLFHYRTSDRQEVDIILEARDGRLVGIECKASSSVSSDQFKGLHALESSVGKKLHRGIVIYAGVESVSFGDRFEALPVSALWEISNQAAPALAE